MCERLSSYSKHDKLDSDTFTVLQELQLLVALSGKVASRRLDHVRESCACCLSAGLHVTSRTAACGWRMMWSIPRPTSLLLRANPVVITVTSFWPSSWDQIQYCTSMYGISFPWANWADGRPNIQIYSIPYHITADESWWEHSQLNKSVRSGDQQAYV